MAKPIIAPPVLTGKAAEKLLKHLEQTKPSKATLELNERAKEDYARIRRMD